MKASITPTDSRVPMPYTGTGTTGTGTTKGFGFAERKCETTFVTVGTRKSNLGPLSLSVPYGLAFQGLSGRQAWGGVLPPVSQART